MDNCPSLDNGIASESQNKSRIGHHRDETDAPPGFLQRVKGKLLRARICEFSFIMRVHN